MHTALLTDRERAAVQAYLRLLHTVRAALDVTAGPSSTSSTSGSRSTSGSSGGDPGGAGRPALIPPSLLAEADQALAEAGMTGNEDDFFALLRAWCPTPPT